MINKLMKRKLLFSFIFSLLCMIFCLCILNCKFDTNDDYGMKLIASGYYGLPDKHLVFINSIIGSVLSFLYKNFNNIAWYELAILLITYLSISLIMYICLSKYNGGGLLITLLLVVLLSLFNYTRIQFTKVATISACAGYISLDYFIDNNKKLNIIISILMITISFLYRLNQFLIVSLIFCGLFIEKIIKYNKYDKKKLFLLLFSILICSFLLLFSISIDKANYNSEEWKNYSEFNDLRGKVKDGYIADYDDYLDEYNKIGLTKTAYKELKNWNFDDDNIYNIESFNKILKIESTVNVINVQSFINFFKDYIRYYLSNKFNIIYMTSLFMFIIIAFLNAEKTNIMPICIGTMFYLLLSFITYILRNFIILDRIQISLLLSFCVLINYCLITSVDNKKIYIWLEICLLFCCLVLSKWYYVDLKNNNETYQNNIEILKTVFSDKNHLYIKRTTEDFDYVNILFYKNEIETNLLSLGGWFTKSPLVEGIKTKYGIRNIYIDSIDNDKILFVTNRITDIIDYINENYYYNVEALYVRSIKDKHVYKVVTKDRMD